MSLKSIDGVPVYDRPFYYHWRIEFWDGVIVNEYATLDGEHRALGQIKTYHDTISNVRRMQWRPFTLARADKVNQNVGYRTTAVSDTNLPSFSVDTVDGKLPYAMRRIVDYKGKLIRAYVLGANRQATTFTINTDWGASRTEPKHIIKRFLDP